MITLFDNLTLFPLLPCFKDRLVLLGNHRDAWTFGAADASSGTAALMEISRKLGEMKEKGRDNYFRVQTNYRIRQRNGVCIGGG